MDVCDKLNNVSFMIDMNITNNDNSRIQSPSFSSCGVWLQERAHVSICVKSIKSLAVPLGMVTWMTVAAHSGAVAALPFNRVVIRMMKQFTNTTVALRQVLVPMLRPLSKLDECFHDEGRLFRNT